MAENPTKLVLKDEKGHFLPGNRAAVGRQPKTPTKMSVMRQQFAAAWTPERMAELDVELYRLCKEAPPKTRLTAIMYVHDRLLGKIKENIDLNVSARPAFDASLYTDEQIEHVLSILDQPSQPVIIDVEPIDTE